MKKNTLKPLTPEQIENYSKNPDNIISDNDYRIIEENTLVVFEPFISNMMYDSIGAYSINCRLSRSIDLLKNGVEISTKRLIREIQNKVDCNLWDDLFCKKYFNNKVSELETDSNRFYNSYKIENDSLERKELYEFYVGAAAEVHELEETIELINEFRDLLLLAIPNLENEFKLKLQDLKKNKSDTKTFADYITSKNKDDIIEKIRNSDRNKPVEIFIILKALIDGGVLLFSNNETMYKAYYNQFGYHKEFDTLKRGLNSHNWVSVESKYIEKIEKMKAFLCD